MRLAIMALMLAMAPPPGAPDLGAAVRARAGSDTQVTVAPRSTGEWGFGTVVRPSAADAYPEGWLFVARRVNGRWQIALEGEPRFAALSAEAAILSTPERAILAAPERPAVDDRAEGGTDRRTGMRLPFAVGQTWRYTGGPHRMGTSARSSVDLAGGDGRVLAARGGVAYTMCRSGRGWVRVVHDRGFATDYYHLERNISGDGTPVAEGAFLGKIGNDVSCGGRSTGKHVHFSLRRDGRYVDIDRYQFGKWVIMAGSKLYHGAARHGSRVVGVGGSLYNYGPLGFTQGVVDTDGGTKLNRRAGPGISYPTVGQVPDGETVTIACSARGTRHTGRYGYTSDLWNKLTDGSWVSDVYVWTGTAEPVNGLCPEHG
ncbi:peptidoglycan DD-metalloendopeptidase family protein [Actinomycetes bacterium KLBMP 9797]